MLVAMAAGIITVGAIDAEFVSEFSFRASLNIFSPINTRRIKDNAREIGAI